MARQYEKRYRLSETDDVLQKLRAIFLDLDQRMDAVESVKEAFEKGNRLDIEALLKALNEDISHKSAAMQELIDEVADGFTPDRISETAEKRFTSDAEQQAHVDSLAEANTRIDARATSASLGVHTSRTDNPHSVTAAQVGTLTTAEIDADLDLLEASILGAASPAADTLGKIEGLLAKRLRVDAPQSFTVAEKGQAIANLGGGGLAGFRNKIINGNFDVWQRQTAQTSTGYGSDDRWLNGHFNCPKNASQQSFPVGQTDVPGNPRYFSRTVVTSVANAANYVSKGQLIEGVATLAGKRVTVTFYAKADAAKNIAVDLAQLFGSGGSPSNAVVGIGARKVALSTVWQKFTFTVDIPSIAGKTLGSNGGDALALTFWFDAGSNFNARTDSLGQQSGTFDVARVSLVPGDATAEDDPFAVRHFNQELALCQRHFWTSGARQGRTIGVGQAFSPTAAGFVLTLPVPMRTNLPAVVALNIYGSTAGGGTVGFGSVLNSYLTGGTQLFMHLGGGSSFIMGDGCLFVLGTSGVDGVVKVDAELAP